MAENRGKKFERVIKDAFQKVPGVSIDRLHDQTNGFRGSENICDFIVYREPYEYYFECKSVHGNRFPLNNLTDNQYMGLLLKSKIEGVCAGVICWWIDKDVTLFIPINNIRIWKEQIDMKSAPYNITEMDLDIIPIHGKKKRVFFEYNMEELLNEISVRYNFNREIK